MQTNLRKMSPKSRLAVFRQKAALQEKQAARLALLAEGMPPRDLEALRQIVERASVEGVISARHASSLAGVIAGRLRKAARRSDK